MRSRSVKRCFQASYSSGAARNAAWIEPEAPVRRRLVLRRGSLSVEQQHDTPPEPEREAPSSEAERLEAEHVLVEPLHLVLGLLEEDARTRRLDKSRRGRLAAFWLASGPADSATIDSSPAGFLRRRAWAKHAICEVSGRV